MTALTALDRDGLCPQQQQENTGEINLFPFKLSQGDRGKEHRKNTKGKQNPSKEKEGEWGEQERLSYKKMEREAEQSVPPQGSLLKAIRSPGDGAQLKF